MPDDPHARLYSIAESTNTSASTSVTASTTSGSGTKEHNQRQADPMLATTTSLHPPMPLIVDDALLKQTDLDTMESFFQQQLGDDLLFNASEQQFLSNFLDGFLETNPLPVVPSYTFAQPPLQPPSAQQEVKSFNFESAIADTQNQDEEDTKTTVVLAPRKKRHASKQLLTDVEKRQNHVLSEQKRRQNIKLGFDALLRIVPTLQEVGEEDKTPQPAKTVILQETIDYLLHLKFRNERLHLRATELARLLSL